MNRIFTYPKEKFEQGILNKRMITKLISKHLMYEVPRLQKNKDYYDGAHEIMRNERKEESAPNQKTVCNHAKDIADTASGYFMGNPITYEQGKGEEETDITKLTDALEAACTDDVDQDNALLLSIYGCSYEYIYVAEGKSELTVRNLDPRNAFVVYDDTIERNELFGVYYYVKRDDINDTRQYIATICTATNIFPMILYPDKLPGKMPPDKEPSEHHLGYVPINEYKNNKFCIGDFEQQIGLIDAYNTLMADRVNDKEQFIDAILVIYGALLGDTPEEAREAYRELGEEKLLELPASGAKAEYLTRTFDETGVETLRKALKEDIYTFSHVPNLTDEKFAGNSSGVAMEYKLLGLEMLTKTKERYYRKGLRKRMQIFCHFLDLKATSIDAASVVPTFSRALPKNLLEIAQMISTLKDSVSKKTLIKLLPFVEDPDGEVEAVEKEGEESIKRQQKLFAVAANEPPDGGEDE
ncbi:phage portal protein [Hominibacterium faecale]|uniref:phage portal protein n=1 Tax=Hominibacterium faecale TaxID=2839743 RepID=UPI0022B29640|nr:phage portal protein [Hominibacterium faecale]